MSVYYNSNGDVVRLGRKLGRGGEGTVYELADETGTVAKIYHEPISPDKAEKLRQMVALQSEKLLKLAAWVTDTLHDTPYGKTIGFLMPKINSGAAIHELYNPRSRRQHFPEADWRFLIAAAANLARAFSTVHAHGHVIGDVNHGNVVIARDATVRLIDCDSYHLNAPERSFLCEVGVSTHTPPELQGVTLREIERTANHDAFGLAVLIFQLLFMGRHPFSGAFLGDGENTLESSIKKQRFAFGDDAETRLMRQPPGTLPLSAVSATIKNLFERAFLQTENRPTAREWVEALDSLSQNLQQCSLNSSHFYLNSLEKCVWCKLEAQTGVMFFPARFTGEFGANGEIDLYTLGQLIDAIKPPDEPQNLLLVKPQNSLVPTSSLPPSPRVKDALKNYNTSLAVYLAVLGVAIVLLVAFVGVSFFFYIFQLAFGGFWVCWGVIKTLTQAAREEAQLALDNSQQKWQNFKEQWDKKKLLQPFDTTRRDLKNAIKQYTELPKQKEARLKELEAERHQRLLDFHLSGFPINKTEVVGLDDERLETLKSSGIKTAADVTNAAFLQLPHFSHSHKRKLFEWRAELEKNFTFNPTAKMKRDELQTAENEIAAVRLQLEAKLRNGLPDLQKIAKQTSQKYQDLVAQSETLAGEVLRAESDFKQVSDLQKTAIAWTVGVVIASFAIGVPVRELTQPSTVNKERTPPLVYHAPTATSETFTKIDSASEKAQELYAQGEAHMRAGLYHDAAVKFERAVRLRPDLEQNHKRLAQAYRALHHNEDALAASQKALDIDPADVETLHLMGDLYQRLNRMDQAITAFLRAVKISPDDASNNYMLGVALRKAGKAQQAITTLKKAIKLYPEYEDAHYELGMCYLQIGDNYQAHKQYEFLELINSERASDLYRELPAVLNKNTDDDNSQYSDGPGRGTGE